MANRLDSMLTEQQRLAMMMGNLTPKNMSVLARTASIPAMPQNYIQNSGTGAVTSLDEFARTRSCARCSRRLITSPDPLKWAA